MLLPRIDFLKTGLALALGWGVAFALFRGWPGIDLAVSGLFWSPEAGFGVLQNPLWEALRNGLWDLEIALAVAAFALMVATWMRGRAVAGLPVRATGFIVALFALGPGVLVNGLFKSFAGRARPATVTEFGGDRLFTPAGTFADQCSRNCSFPSGEVSSVVAMAVALWLVAALPGAMPVRGRRALRIFAVVAALFVIAQRIVAGRHFLSDTVFAALMVLTLAWGLYALVSGRFAQARRG